jgi:hypothetical protein
MRSESSPAVEASSWVDRLVEAVPVAVVAAVPTFLRARAAQEGVGTALSAFALAAMLTLLPAVAMLLLLRRALEGARAFAGDTSVVAAGVGVAASVFTLAFWQRLGAFLAHATHHRGLGGVAFAAGAVVLASAVALVGGRAHRFVAAQGPTVATFVGVAGFFTPLLLLAAASAPGEPAPAADPLGLFVVDGLGLLLAAFAWVQHLAPIAWPPRARGLVGAGAALLAFAGCAFLDVPSESPREGLAFVFRFLTVR